MIDLSKCEYCKDCRSCEVDSFQVFDGIYYNKKKNQHYLIIVDHFKEIKYCPMCSRGLKVNEIKYKIEADMHVVPLEVEYDECDYDKALVHFNSWVKDYDVFNIITWRLHTGKNAKVVYELKI